MKPTFTANPSTVLTILAVTGFFNLGLKGTCLARKVDVTLGIRAGMSLSRIGGDDGLENSRPGLAGGYSLTFSLSETFAIQQEMIHVQKGGHGRDTSRSFTYTTNTRLDYLEIPILLKYSNFASIRGDLRPALLFGPVFAVSTRTWASVADVEGSLHVAPFEDSLPLSDDFDVGLALGADLKRASDQGVFSWKRAMFLGFSTLGASRRSPSVTYPTTLIRIQQSVT